MNIKIWIDEAWRWPYIWPLVACSFALNPKYKNHPEFINKLKDSKKLTKKQREFLFDEIIKNSLWDNPLIFFGIWVVDNYFIDEVNIKNANKEAIRRSIVEIKRKISNFKIDSVLIDWNDNYIFEELSKKPTYIIWWDQKVLEISWASIIAKVFRDKLIDTYAILYPEIWLEKHKWYWTKAHRDYLTDKSKINSFYRTSYKPIKEILEN